MRITIKDIARMTGVSYSTVSKALNNSPLVKEETKSKILKIADQFGYEPNFAAQSLVCKKSNTIGVLWPTVERVALAALVTQINTKLEQQAYSMLLSINPIESAIKLFNRYQADAILMFDEYSEQSLDALSSIVPVLCYGDSGSFKFPTMKANRRDAIRKATHFLSTMGHRRIAYIGDLSRQSNQQEKYIGYMEGVIRDGLESHPRMATDSMGLTWQEGYRAAQDLLHSDYRPTAIVSGSYDLSVGIIRAINEMHLQIPEDISLISYDNIPQQEDLEIPLTAVGAPLDQISTRIVASLLSIIEKTGFDPLRSQVDNELAVRNSCCPPK